MSISVNNFIHIEIIKSNTPNTIWIPEPFLVILSSEIEKFVLLVIDIIYHIGNQIEKLIQIYSTKHKIKRLSKVK